MKLSTKGRYATRIMLEIVKHYGASPVHLDDIEEKQGISKNYAENLLRLLRKKGLVISIKGPGGGFSLSREPSEITIGEIIKASEGPVELVECISNKNACERVDSCITRLLWKRTSERIDEVFNSITLDDLLFEEKREEKKGGKITKKDVFGKITKILALTRNMADLLQGGFMDNSQMALDRVLSIGRRIDIESSDTLEALEKSNLSSFIPIFSYLERIGDSLESISYSAKTKIEKRLFFSKATLDEVKTLFDGTNNILQSLIGYLEKPCKTSFLNIIKETKDLLVFVNKYRVFHEKRLEDGQCLPQSFPMYLDILDSFKNIFEHIIELSKHKGLKKIVMGNGPVIEGEDSHL